MPRLLLIGLLVVGLSSRTAAQVTSYEQLVAQGLELYKNDQNAEALDRFQQALKLKPNDFQAQYGTALVYYTTGRYAESATLCEALVKRGDDKLPNLYVTYGTSLDRQHKSAEAVQVYEQALKKFPDDESLWRYQGIAQQGLKHYAEAASSFEQALRRRPAYATTHLLLAQVAAAQGERVPALLACIRTMMLETSATRFIAEGKMVDQLLQAGVQQTSPKAVSLNMSAEALAQASESAKNDSGFASAEVLLTLEAALDYDQKNKNKNPGERLAEKLSALCDDLNKQPVAQPQNFTRQFYAPFFIALDKQGHTPALAYFLRSSQSAEAPAVAGWVKQHQPQMQAMAAWSKAYEWPK